MLLMKIFFAVLIIICIIFYIMYLWDFALMLLVIVCTVPVIMFITTFITKKLISVELAIKNDTAVKRENFPVQIKIKNRSIFPIGRAEACIEYCNVFNNEISTFNLYMPIQARNDQNVCFQMHSKFCGIVKIRCVHIMIFDPLKIFKFKVGKNIQTEIAIMPEGHEISGEICYTDRANDESPVFSDHKPGDDPSEIFDLRDYIPGDRINRIHWKLSSKRNEFIVKDYSLPIDIPCTLFLNLKCNEKSEYTLPIFDTLVETFVSISRFLIENERSHNVVYYNFKYKKFIEKNICDNDSLTEVIHDLVLSVSDTVTCDPPELYFDESGSLSLSSFVFITSECEESVIEFIDENIDADIKNAVVVVTSPDEAAKLNTGCSDINIIPVVIGRISSSIKDIEL